MIRRMVCVFCAAVLLMGTCIQAAAASETGTIRVALRTWGGTVSSGAVTLYKAGESVPGGYRLCDCFGGGFLAEEDAMSGALARYLAEEAGQEGTTRLLDADGCTEFTGLEEGLYLLVQSEETEGYYAMTPFLVALPYEGEWIVEAAPKMRRLPEEQPQTGQHPAPILAAMGLVLSGVGLVLCADRKHRK